MNQKTNARVDFIDGWVREKNWIYINGELQALKLDGIDLTRCFSLKEGRWGVMDIEKKAISSFCVSALPQKTTYFLDEEGTVLVRTSGKLVSETLPGAGIGDGQFGYTLHIREIGHTLYVCGENGQIYRREEGRWAHFDKGLCEIGAPDLHCIDGVAEEDIYSVGEKGKLFHHDGRAWTEFQLPTTNTLWWVRAASADEIYICGRVGSFFAGHRTEWKDFSAPKLNVHFSCAEVFNGKVYLAAQQGLFLFDGKQILPIDTGLSPEPDGHRLHANDGVLWSFGVHHLCFFDGKKWTYVKHPDNP